MKVFTSLLMSSLLFLSTCGLNMPIARAMVSLNNSYMARREYKMNSEELKNFLVEKVYPDVSNSFIGTGYEVKDIQAIYISKEYIDELRYNSLENNYFGKTISQLTETFEGRCYFFTVGDDGKTVVKEIQELDNSKTVEMMQNFAVGAGVIVVLVVLTVATGGGAAPVAHAVFMGAAKGAVYGALEGAALGAVAKGGYKYIETGDIDKAIEEAKYGAAEGFKWGAIFGSLKGGSDGWKNSIGVRNKIAGVGREQKVFDKLSKEYPTNKGHKVIPEQYLRDSSGKIVKDPNTGCARRIDFVVVKDKQVVKSVEVTSQTADKTAQMAKEKNIRDLGGEFVKDPETGELLRIPDTLVTTIERFE